MARQYIPRDFDFSRRRKSSKERSNGKMANATAEEISLLKRLQADLQREFEAVLIEREKAVQSLKDEVSRLQDRIRHWMVVDAGLYNEILLRIQKMIEIGEKITGQLRMFKLVIQDMESGTAQFENTAKPDSAAEAIEKVINSSFFQKDLSQWQQALVLAHLFFGKDFFSPLTIERKIKDWDVPLLGVKVFRALHHCAHRHPTTQMARKRITSEERKEKGYAQSERYLYGLNDIGRAEVLTIMAEIEGKEAEVT